jgi:hypothetical protein
MRLGGHGSENLPLQVQGAETANDLYGGLSVGLDAQGGKALAILLGQRGIKDIPLGLESTA